MMRWVRNLELIILSTTSIMIDQINVGDIFTGMFEIYYNYQYNIYYVLSVTLSRFSKNPELG